MKKRKIIICIVSLIAVACLCVLAALMIRCINSAGDDAALRWTMIGAFGSWAGSIFGAFALIISLFALWLPQKVKLKVAVSTGMMVSQMPGVERIDAYIITVKNIGVRPITVNNVYLHFGNKKNGDIFVGMLNQGTLLQAYTISFPKRLDQGESFDYYLLKDKLDIALAHYEENTPLKTPLSIRVSEVTRGDRYFKTPWTLGTFIGHKK